MTGVGIRTFVLAVTMVAVSRCGVAGKTKGPSEGALATTSTAAESDATLDTHAIEESLGLKGMSMPDGVFRVTEPRSDLKVTLDGFPITPPMGLAGWMAFRAHASGAILLGMLPVTTDELQPVVSALTKAGLEATAVHDHFVGEEPRITFVHFGGLGIPVALARGVHDVLDAIVRVRAGRPLKPPAAESRFDFDVAKLDTLLGLHGEHDDRTYRVSLPRADLRISAFGIELGPTMSPASWATFQGTAERAAVTGELMLLPSEVQPVIHALREARLGVVGIHDSSLREEPRVSFVSFWGIGRIDVLAAGLRKALDQLPRGG